MFKRFLSIIGTMWCTLKHDAVMWPVHGTYECRACGRRYPAFAETPIAHYTRGLIWRPAQSLLLALALGILAAPAHAIVNRHTPADANTALDRFIAQLDSAPWAIESMELHASLSRIENTGQMTAIRRLGSTDGSSYEVLQVVSDRKVEKELLSRFVLVDQRNSAIAESPFELTRANYRFTYKGVIDDGEYSAYIFEISPRSKKHGLMKGELWLDRQTGAPVRQSGRLVKNPLPSVRRVSVRRENAFRDGLVESRITRITCKTRKAGRAELVVIERPLSSAEALELAAARDDAVRQ